MCIEDLYLACLGAYSAINSRSTRYISLQGLRVQLASPKGTWRFERSNLHLACRLFSSILFVKCYDCFLWAPCQSSPHLKRLHHKWSWVHVNLIWNDCCIFNETLSSSRQLCRTTIMIQSFHTPRSQLNRFLNPCPLNKPAPKGKHMYS